MNEVGSKSLVRKDKHTTCNLNIIGLSFAFTTDSLQYETMKRDIRRDHACLHLAKLRQFYPYYKRQYPAMQHCTNSAPDATERSSNMYKYENAPFKQPWLLIHVYYTSVI